MAYIPESYTVDPSAISSMPRPKVADEIWIEIKSTDIQAFGLPGQTIDKYCAPIPVEPTKLYLKYTMSTVVPFMIEKLGSKYDINLDGLYITVARKETK